MDFITSRHFDTFSSNSDVSSTITQIKTEKTEIKEETIEDFEAHEQDRSDYIASKDFDHLFSKSETSRMKTEFKPKVKEEAFEEFDTHEQIGMDFITSQHFDTHSNKSDISSIKKDIKFEDQIKNEIKEEIKFETGVQRGLEILEKLELPIENKISQETNESQEANSAFEKIGENEDMQLLQVKTEVKAEFKEETIEDFDAQEQIGIDLITNKDFNY